MWGLFTPEEWKAIKEQAFVNEQRSAWSTTLRCL